MDGYEEVLRALGRIEGELVGIRKLSERVSKLEIWLYFVKGAWAALMLCFLYLCRLALGR